uniref:Thylakoid membrane protein slr0575 n=1 Tax=Noccaea caerulescens TaxID=107243 RepID=A0A1J3IZM1_NOCCA
MGTISAASGTTVLSSNLRRQNIRRLGLYDRRHDNLSVVSSSQPPVPPRQRWLHVPETRLKREIRRLDFVAGAADSTSSSPSMVSGDKTLIPDDEFTLAKISFGVIGLSLGVSLLSYGFGAYFNILPGSEWSAIMLTYGFPLAIIGMALKYAELKPVPCLSYSDAVKLRESCATPILTQVRNDVTRYRYGDEQHLEEALKRIFQYGLGGGIPRRSAPTLTMIREEVLTDGRYCLVLVFEAKALNLSDFEKRQAKFTSFFGPNITAEVGKGESENLYEVRLISNVTTNSVSSSTP